MTDFLENQGGREANFSAARYAGLDLPNRPRLAPWLIAVDLGDSRLQFRSAESSHTLAHPLLIQVFRRIERLLDGRHSVDDIVASVNSEVLPTTVLFLLKLLRGKGLLQPGVGESTFDDEEQASRRRQLRFLSHFVADASSAQTLLAKARVGVVGSADLRQAIASAIDSIGVGSISELGEPSTWDTEAGGEPASLDVIVACQDWPAFTFFDAVNRACLVSGIRWFRVAISGTSAQLGPTVVPNQTACYTCLDLRLQTHEPDLDGYRAYRAQVNTPDSRSDEGCLAPLWSVVAGQVALEVMRLLTGFASPVTIGRFYEFTAVSPAVIWHDVLRVPRCSSCGRRRTFTEAWDHSVLPTEVDS
jgi:bacteriocin biosynthesis cyclodehydratase domain-containing protein